VELEAEAVDDERTQEQRTGYDHHGERVAAQVPAERAVNWNLHFEDEFRAIVRSLAKIVRAAT